MKDNNKNHFQYECEKGLLTVIVVTFRTGDYLFEAIDSALGQDYGSVELIISDDGTEDFNEKIITDYIEINKTDRLKMVNVIHREKNVGTVRNINIALMASHGEFIKLLGGDDTYPIPDTFSRQVKIMQTQGSLANVGKAQQCDENMNPIADERMEKSNAALQQVLTMDYIEARRYIAKKDIFPIANQAVCYHRQFFEEQGFCNEDYCLIEDTILANRLLFISKKVSYLDDYTVNHRSKVGISTSRELFAPRRILYYKDCVTYAIQEIDHHPELFGCLYRKENVRVSKFVYEMALAKSRKKSGLALVGISLKYIDTMIYYVAVNNKKFIRRIKTRILG